MPQQQYRTLARKFVSAVRDTRPGRARVAKQELEGEIVTPDGTVDVDSLLWETAGDDGDSADDHRGDLQLPEASSPGTERGQESVVSAGRSSGRQ